MRWVKLIVCDTNTFRIKICVRASMIPLPSHSPSMKMIRNQFCILHWEFMRRLHHGWAPASWTGSLESWTDSLLSWTGSSESWTGSPESWTGSPDWGTDSVEASTSAFWSGSKSSGLSFLVSAMSRLMPTIHWLTSVTWSTIRDRWILSAASQWPDCNSERQMGDVGGKQVRTLNASSGRQTGVVVRQVTLSEGVHASPHRKAQFTSLPAVL